MSGMQLSNLRSLPAKQAFGIFRKQSEAVSLQIALRKDATNRIDQTNHHGH